MSKLGQINASMLTDQGLVREHNEDFIASWEPTNAAEEAKHGWLYIVADGVGGADAGEVASQYATEQVMAHYLANSHTDNWGLRLINAMQTANTDLRQMVAERNGNKRMATTMVAAVIQENQAFVGNVGDSRGYHWRNGELKQITRDQSLVAKLLEEGAITEAEAAEHPHKNVILYSIGSEKSPKMDLFKLDLQANDILLLCSDGLTRHVSDQEISQKLEQEPISDVVESLVKLAKERGGQDNISVCIIVLNEQADNIVTQQLPKQPDRPMPHPSGTPSSTLLLYTILLSLIQTILMLIVWLLLRV